MKTFLLSLFLLAGSAFAQTATIPANSMTFTGTVNGIAITLTGPKVAVSVPITGITASSGLPNGMTYSSTAGLNVVGPITSNGLITGTQLSLTSGTAPATSPTGFYVYSLVNGVYALVPLPAVSITQLASPANTFTITP